jgi:hypothetical protein
VQKWPRRAPAWRRHTTIAIGTGKPSTGGLIISGFGAKVASVGGLVIQQQVPSAALSKIDDGQRSNRRDVVDYDCPEALVTDVRALANGPLAASIPIIEAARILRAGVAFLQPLAAADSAIFTTLLSEQFLPGLGPAPGGVLS